ncbi:MAG: efflux RND transporter permease subunit, partial [Planctomycetota bacterium]
RPIVMTSCAFVLGVVPLIIGSGAGSEMRRALGVAMFCGMVGVTIFGVLLTPNFFYTLRRIGATRLFSNRAFSASGTLVGGPIVGFSLGMLLWLSAAFGFWWAILLGTSAGLAAAVLVLGWRRPPTPSGSSSTAAASEGEAP